MSGENICARAYPHACFTFARSLWSSSKASPPGREPHQTTPLRDVSTGEETDATAILPISHPVNGVGRLLAVAFSKSVGDKDLFPAETNYHVLLQNLLAAAAVHLTAAATRRERLCVFCALTGFVFCNNNATRMRQNSLSDEPPTNWVSAESS